MKILTFLRYRCITEKSSLGKIISNVKYQTDNVMLQLTVHALCYHLMIDNFNYRGLQNSASNTGI